MSKAILIMEMPENCRDCEYFGFTCRLTKQKCNYFKEDGRHENCPIRELPEKKPPCNLKPSPIINEYYQEYDRGWNDCMDAITGEKQAPVKPIKEWDRTKGDKTYYRYVCRECENILNPGDIYKYCPYCGQALDWED